MNRSLSGDTKDALANELPSNPNARKSLAAAILAYGATRSQGFLTRRLTIARALHRLLADATIRKEPGHSSILVHTPGTLPILGPLESTLRTVSHRRTELRGAFLACGSISVSKRGGYHLEFVLHTEQLAARLIALLKAEELEAKTLLRRDHHVVYLKDAERIIALLSAIGAFPTVLRLEDMLAVKDTKNRIRRIVNTEAANLDRTIDAASSARTTIEALIEAYGLSELSPALREAATLRLEYPLASLAELGQHCSPPVGKSTFGGRLAALRRLAENLSS